MRYNAINFMSNRQIGKELQLRVLKYIEYIHDLENDSPDKGFAVINQISKNLKTQIYNDYYGKVLMHEKSFSLNFSKKSIEKLSLRIKERLYGPGEVIFEQEEQDYRLYYLMKGECEFYQYNKGGSKQSESKTIYLSSEKKFFGYKGFISGIPREMSCRSTNISHVFIITRQDLIEVLKEDPEDYEQFCKLRDQYLLYKNTLGEQCFACSKFGHTLIGCPQIHLIRNKELLIFRNNFSVNQKRQRAVRNKKKFQTLLGKPILSQSAQKYRLQMIVDYRRNQMNDENESISDIILMADLTDKKFSKMYPYVIQFFIGPFILLKRNLEFNEYQINCYIFLFIWEQMRFKSSELVFYDNYDEDVLSEYSSSDTNSSSETSSESQSCETISEEEDQIEEEDDDKVKEEDEDEEEDDKEGESNGSSKQKIENNTKEEIVDEEIEEKIDSSKSIAKSTKNNDDNEIGNQIFIKRRQSRKSVETKNNTSLTEIDDFVPIKQVSSNWSLAQLQTSRETSMKSSTTSTSVMANDQLSNRILKRNKSKSTFEPISELREGLFHHTTILNPSRGMISSQFKQNTPPPIELQRLNRVRVGSKTIVQPSLSKESSRKDYRGITDSPKFSRSNTKKMTEGFSRKQTYTPLSAAIKKKQSRVDFADQDQYQQIDDQDFLIRDFEFKTDKQIPSYPIIQQNKFFKSHSLLQKQNTEGQRFSKIQDTLQAQKKDTLLKVYERQNLYLQQLLNNLTQVNNNNNHHHTNGPRKRNSSLLGNIVAINKEKEESNPSGQFSKQTTMKMNYNNMSMVELGESPKTNEQNNNRQQTVIDINAEQNLPINELFIFEFDALREYTKYFPHNNAALVCQSNRMFQEKKKRLGKFLFQKLRFDKFNFSSNNSARLLTPSNKK